MQRASLLTAIFNRAYNYDVVRNEDILKLPVRLGANKLLSNIASIIIQGVSYYEQCFIYHNKNYSAQ